MKTIMTAARVSAVVVSVALAGCTPTTEVASTVTSQAPPGIRVGAPAPDETTLHQYIVDNRIAELRFTRGEPGTPKIEFPFPPGWRSAGDRTPDWAYGAIVYDTPKDPADPPYMVAIASKLSGEVDPAAILQYAPGQLNRLTDFTPFHGPRTDSLSGFDAVDYAGTYVNKGKPRVIGQQTIVVPGNDALFVLQLNADAPKGEEQAVIDAAKFIAEHTKISAPN